MSSLPMIVSSGGGGAVITITYTEDFYNQTITCSHGSKTYSKTATSSGSVEFNVGEEGQWVISCVIDGQPYTTTVDIDLSGEGALSKGINGKTVLPTDDIDTWIKCAGLQNTNNYSTLAEVLADTELFDTLLRDSNACDYMARSTSWALQSGLIPIMTSATQPSGEVRWSSQYASGREGWKAFSKGYDDGTNNTMWVGNPSNYSDEWIEYVFPTATHVGKIVLSLLVGKNDNACRDGSYKLQVSDDGTAYTDVQTISWLKANGVTTVDVENGGSHRYWRIKTIASNWVNSTYPNGYSQFAYIQFYADADIATNQSAMQRVGRYDYCSESLLNNATWCEAIVNSEYFEEILDVTNPAMTSTTTPSGYVTSSSGEAYSDEPSWKAFDKNLSSAWSSQATQNNRWVKLAFPTSIIPTAIYVKYMNAVDRNADWLLQVSNDDSNWTTIKTIAGKTSSWAIEDTTVIFNSEKNKYRYFRMFTNGSGKQTVAAVYEMMIYARHDSNKYIPLVPIMTSNTTPSGTVTCSTPFNSSYDGYKAFDGNGSTEFVTQDGDTGRHITYEFPTPVVPDRMYYRIVNAYNRNTDWLLQGSLDGTTWDTFLTIPRNTSGDPVSGVMAEGTIDINSSKNSYKYFRAITNKGTTYTSEVCELQLYKKVPPTKQIHSCPNDTIYIMRNGSPVTIATTDLDGVGEIDWTDFDEGDLTLYSSVAKDPANLSNDYSKVCRITKTQYGHTTDFYLMPDNALYWWGYIGDNCESLLHENGWNYHYYDAFSAPTYNTTNVVCTSLQTYFLSGIGTKNTIASADVVKGIVNGKGSIWGKTAKAFNNPDNNYVGTRIDFNINALTTVSSDVSSGSNFYVGMHTGEQSFTAYALWYE